MRLSILPLLSLPPLVVFAVPTNSSHGAVSIPIFKRSSFVDGNGILRPEVLGYDRSRAVAKMQRGFDAYERNTGIAHPSRVRYFQRRASGPESLFPQDGGSLWHGNILVGTPPMPFTIDFDTGSSDLFLPGPHCKIDCEGHRIYDMATSSTAKDLGKTFSTQFGDGSTVQGEQISDTVSIAGLSATKQTLGAATTYSSGFNLASFVPDGLLGMAFADISTFGAAPFFQTLVAEGKTTVPEFAFKLTQDSSELYLGGVNTKLYKGGFTQLPILEGGFWQVAMESIKFKGEIIGEGFSAVVDTGTTLVMGDRDVVAALYAAIPGAQEAPSRIGDGFYTVPCNDIPIVSLTFGGKVFPISPETFNLGQVGTGSADCVGGVAALGSDVGLPPNTFIVGDVFLQNVYTVFNVNIRRVGFATLA